MSHIVIVKTQFHNLEMIVKAAQARGCTTIVCGKHEVELYERKVQGDASFKLPGWQYPIVIDTGAGEAFYDHFNGRWGDITEFNRFNQEYILQVAAVELEEEYRLQGYTLQRLTLKNGDVQLVAVLP